MIANTVHVQKVIIGLRDEILNLKEDISGHLNLAELVVPVIRGIISAAEACRAGADADGAWPG